MRPGNLLSCLVLIVSGIAGCRGDVINCRTTLTKNEDLKSNASCVFPFRFKGIVHDGCTTFYDKDKRLWCSTKVDLDGNHVKKKGEWGYCPSSLEGCQKSSVDLIWEEEVIKDKDISVRAGNEGIVKEQVNKTCENNEKCLNRQSCDHVDQQYILMEKLKKQRKSDERNKIIKELKSQVCNWEEKAFCCPHCSATNPCLSQPDCPHISKQIDTLIHLQRNSSQYLETKAGIQSYICEKDKQTFCCPINSAPIKLSPTNTTAIEEEFVDTRTNINPIKTPANSLSPNIGAQIESSGALESPTLLPQPNGTACGLAEKHPGFVFGGEDTRPGEFPFTALLGYKDTCVKVTYTEAGGRRRRKVECFKLRCGGTLINRWHVLTAAHCQGDKPSKQVAQVVLGEWDVRVDPDFDYLDPIQKFSIGPGRVTVHPEFTRTGSNVINDIALVRLPRPAILNRQVKVACLPLDMTEAAVNLGVPDLDSGLESARPTVVGWGYTELNPVGDWKAAGVATSTQQKVEVPVVSSSQCRAAWGDKFQPEHTQVCAGGELGKDSCGGDSGSGLFLEGERWFQIGIVSFGTKRCGNGKPGVYTRTSALVPWITANLTP